MYEEIRCVTCQIGWKELVTNAWLFWSLIYTTPMISQLVMWDILHNNADWDCCRTLILLETSTTKKQHQEVFYAYSEVKRLYQSGKKQTSDSNNSTNAEIISLDAGLCMDGIPTLSLWDLVFGVLHSSPTQFKKPKDGAQGNLSHTTSSSKHTNVHTKNQQDDLELCNGNCFLKREFCPIWCEAFQNSLSCVWLVFDRTKLDPKSKSNTLIPKTNSQT